MFTHPAMRTLIYILVGYFSYSGLSYLSPSVDLSAKGIALPVAAQTQAKAIDASDVRLLPFQPENTETVAWINIEKAESEVNSRELAEQKARELAASVGAEGVVVLGEGDTLNLGPSKYSLFIFRGKAVRYMN